MRIIRIFAFLCVPLFVWGNTVEPQNNENVNWDCYLSYISILVTFVVGYQIWNVIQIQKKQKELDNKQKRLERKQKLLNKQINIQKNISQELNCFNNGVTIFNNGEDVHTRARDALLAFHQTLVYSIEIKHTDYEWIFEWLDKCIEELTYNAFISSRMLDTKSKELPNGIEDFKKLIDEDRRKIIKSDNYIKIKLLYVPMMEKLENKLCEIKENPTGESNK